MDEQNKLFYVYAALEFGANDIFREMEDKIYYFATNRMVSMRLMTKSCSSETCNKLMQLIEFFQEMSAMSRASTMAYICKSHLDTATTATCCNTGLQNRNTCSLTRRRPFRQAA